VLVLLAEICVVSLVAARSPIPDVLRAALVADAVLLSALALWLAGGPRALGLTPVRAIRAAVLGVVLFALASRVSGLSDGGGLLLLAGLAELSLLGFLCFALVKAAREKGDGWERAHAGLSVVFPPKAARMLLMEARLVHGAVLSLLRRPTRGPPASETVFRPLEASSTGWLIPFFVLASAVEMAAVHAVVHVKWPGHPMVQLALFGLHLYGILWLIGERRLMRDSAHVFEPDALVLNLGLRFSARVPYALITRALPLRDDLERKSVQPKPDGSNPRASPFDPPNVHLCLAGPVRYTTLLGLEREAQHLDLFVDRPEAFLAAVEARRTAAVKAEPA
jgi:hypothetical protein